MYLISLWIWVLLPDFLNSICYAVVEGKLVVTVASSHCLQDPVLNSRGPVESFSFLLRYTGKTTLEHAVPSHSGVGVERGMCSRDLTVFGRILGLFCSVSATVGLVL